MQRTMIGILAVVAGCGGSSRHWVEHACEVSLSNDRTAFVYVSDDAVGLRRDGQDIRVPFTGCLATGKNIVAAVALNDGWSAFVYGYRKEGGSIYHGNGTIVEEDACLVDFRTRTSTAVDVNLLAGVRHAELEVGAVTGRLYVHDLGGRTIVVDLATREAHPLGVDAKRVTESGSRLRAVGVELESTDPARPIYKSTLVITDFKPGSWPPAPQSTRRTVVGGRVDRVAVSADGTWAAYSGAPYYVGIEIDGPVADLGLVDLDSGAIAFEQLAQKGSASAEDVVTRTGGPAVLVGRTGERDSSGPLEVAWLDAKGQRVSSGTYRASHLKWFAGAKRVLVSGYCEHDLAELPPP